MTDLRVHLPRPVRHVQARRGDGPERGASEGLWARAEAAAAGREAFRQRVEREVEAVRQALQADYEARLAAERQELAQARQALAATVREFTRLREQMIADMEEQLLDLSLEIARKVLAQEIQAERYQIDPIIAGALEQLGRHDEIQVQLNPADLERSSLAADADGAAEAGLQFVANPRLGRGEARIEVAEGTIAVGVDAHLNQVAEALRPGDPE